eukprot:COSAG01_NODE_4392_length_5071_cov_14.381738_8_plen_88_part_00
MLATARRPSAVLAHDASLVPTVSGWPQVDICLHALGRAAYTIPGYEGPCLGRPPMDVRVWQCLGAVARTHTCYHTAVGACVHAASGS